MKWWQIRKRNEDLERELRSDLELEEEEQRDNGMSPEEARFAARRGWIRWRGPEFGTLRWRLWRFPFDVGQREGTNSFRYRVGNGNRTHLLRHWTRGSFAFG